MYKKIEKQKTIFEKFLNVFLLPYETTNKEAN